MAFREVLIDAIRDVGRERESSIAMMVLCIDSMVAWKFVYGDVEVGASVLT